MENRIIVWFSCGAASAVAAKLATEKYGSGVKIVYCDTMESEHSDNSRFFQDVEKWIGQEIMRIKSINFKTIDDVFEHRRYLSGIKGAPCTVEMKKIPRFDFQKPDDIHIFGFTSDESKRIERFQNQNPELYLEWILKDNGISKQNCFEILEEAQIILPMMYRLGFKNNNCLGCVKSGSVKYWNMIRKHFPEVYEKRCIQSRRYGAKLINTKNNIHIFLDEMPILEDMDSYPEIAEDLSCGPQCSTN